jgi:hypothetical protein
MARRERMLDLRSGGWLVILAVLLVAAIVWWMVLPVLRTASRAVGDGSNVETYGFDLSAFTLSRDVLVAAGFPKNGVPTLDAPAMLRGSDVVAFNEEHRGKYLVSEDRVVGVALGGSARAYPLRVLNWHEVVNDTLDGVPIAVTYHPLCDSVVVFDRRVGDEVLELGVSGLLYNSNHLLFDRRADGRAESLWSQLLARAVAGPAAEAGVELRVLPSSVVQWRRWLERHPNTEVVAPDPHLLKRYQRDPYGNYLVTGELRFPVDPLPPEGARGLMEPVVVLEAGREREVLSLAECVASGSGGGPCDARGWLTVYPGERFDGALVDAPLEARAFHSLWFAWYAASRSQS